MSQGRADSKRYPAVDPVDSYSKYLEYPEICEYLNKTIDKNWTENVSEGKNIILRGREAYEQINILGDDSVPVEYHDRFWKSELIDYVILQQDAFDAIDASAPLKRQQFMFEKVLDICKTAFKFNNFNECIDFYKRIINNMRQMNYAVFQSNEFKKYEKELSKIISERVI